MSLYLVRTVTRSRSCSTLNLSRTSGGMGWGPCIISIQASSPQMAWTMVPIGSFCSDRSQSGNRFTVVVEICNSIPWMEKMPDSSRVISVSPIKTSAPVALAAVDKSSCPFWKSASVPTGISSPSGSGMVMSISVMSPRLARSLSKSSLSPTIKVNILG